MEDFHEIHGAGVGLAGKAESKTVEEVGSGGDTDGRRAEDVFDGSLPGQQRRHCWKDQFAGILQDRKDRHCLWYDWWVDTSRYALNDWRRVDRRQTAVGPHEKKVATADPQCSDLQQTAVRLWTAGFQLAGVAMLPFSQKGKKFRMERL